MRKITVLALIAFAVSVLIVAQTGPTYAAQTTGGTNSVVTATDQVVGTQSPVPVQLVRGVHSGGHMAFSRGRVGAWRGARFNSFRFHNARFRHFRHFRPFVFSSVVPYSYYSSYNNNCYWDGYAWVCDDLY
jgi:hypothetical protein